MYNISMYIFLFKLFNFFQFDSSTTACSWFLNHMADDDTWPVTIFLKCQVATIRQMFHRLCIHVIQKLR
jgi:ubiquitin carboxyl-terminal hydrolase 34